MSRRYVFLAILSLIINLFVACDDENASSSETNNLNNTNLSNETNNSNNETEEFCENCIHYDIETMDPGINQISNGEQRHLGTLMIFVDHAENKNFILKSLRVKLESSDQEEEKREDFYRSFDNFRIKVNGIDFSNNLNIISPSEISIPALSLDISPEQPTLVEIWADIDSVFTEINGRVSMDDFVIRDKDDESHLLEQYLDAELGYNQCTLLLNWQSLARTADPVCSMPGALKILNEFEEEIEEPAHYINYDVEANYLDQTIYTLVAEGNWSESEQFWTNFRVHVDHNHSEDMYIKYISFKLRGIGTVEEEAAFYEALMGAHLYFKINGNYYFPSTETLTERGFYIMEPITEQMPVTENLFFTISAYLWNIDTDFDLLRGSIEVESIVFGDTPQAGIDEFEWEQNWDPNMGLSNGTCIIQEYQGSPANWQAAHLNIIKSAQ